MTNALPVAQYNSLMLGVVKMSEYVTLKAQFSFRNKNVCQKFYSICENCKKQTSGRVCRDVNMNVTTAGGLTAPVTMIKKPTKAKAFLDKVCGSNCGELIVQYCDSNSNSVGDGVALIIKKRDGMFWAISNSAMSSILLQYDGTIQKYEAAKKKAGFFESMKAGALGSRVSSLGGWYFDDLDRKILKIRLDCNTVEEKIRGIEEFFTAHNTKFRFKEIGVSNYGCFANVFEADDFIRKKDNPLYVEVVDENIYKLPPIALTSFYLTVTFKYNPDFYKEVKAFVTSRFIENRQECLEVLKRLDSSPDRPADSHIAAPYAQDDPDVQKAFSLVEKDLFHALSAGVRNIIEDFKQLTVSKAAFNLSNEKNISDAVKGVQFIRTIIKEVRQKLNVRKIAELEMNSNLLEEINIGLREAQELNEDINLFKSDFVKMATFSDRQGKILLIKDTCNLLQPVGGVITGILDVMRAIKETFGLK